MLESKKGKGGGYYLKVSPKNINLATVIRVINGPIALLPCVSLNFYEKCADCDETHCGIRKMMTITRDATLKILEKKTLQDILVAAVLIYFPAALIHSRRQTCFSHHQLLYTKYFSFHILKKIGLHGIIG